MRDIRKYQGKCSVCLSWKKVHYVEGESREAGRHACDTYQQYPRCGGD